MHHTNRWNSSLRLVSQIKSLHIFPFLIQCPIICYKKNQVNRRFCLVILVSSLTICFFYTISNQSTTNGESFSELTPTHIFDPNTSLRLPLSIMKNHTYELVLLWSDLFEYSHWHQPTYFNSSTIISCSPTHQCLFTRDKRLLSRASIVAFHLYDMKRADFPERKLSTNVRQQWIFITGESPINFYYHNPSFAPYMLNNYFDRSISYKFDSPYPVFAPLLKPQNLSAEQLEHEHQLNIRSMKLKKKPILWFVSNCVTFSQREKYVEQLKNYLAVDIFGQCGTPCSKDSSDRPCPVDVDDYYFYLALENSRCHSYITEKFWNVIADRKHRIIPIVMGADEKDYEQVAPRRSFIHVNHYQTVEDLAKYLDFLMKNPKKYFEYFQWREQTEIELLNPSRWNSLLCPLCQMTKQIRMSSPATRMNFSTWYNPKVDCHADDVEMFSKCKRVDMNTLMSWTHHIKCP